MWMKNSNYTIGNRTRDLPACSAVRQRVPLTGTIVPLLTFITLAMQFWSTYAFGISQQFENLSESYIMTMSWILINKHKHYRRSLFNEGNTCSSCPCSLTALRVSLRWLRWLLSSSVVARRTFLSLGSWNRFLPLFAQEVCLWRNCFSISYFNTYVCEIINYSERLFLSIFLLSRYIPTKAYVQST